MCLCLVAKRNSVSKDERQIKFCFQSFLPTSFSSAPHRNICCPQKTGVRLRMQTDITAWIHHQLPQMSHVTLPFCLKEEIKGNSFYH